jgi:hypothetical protein
MARHCRLTYLFSVASGHAPVSCLVSCLHYSLRGRASATGFTGLQARGKGLACGFERFVTNLPLRGKLGWMTPRAGVKTTPALKRAFRGSRSQAGAPVFCRATWAGDPLPGRGLPQLEADGSVFNWRRVHLFLCRRRSDAVQPQVHGRFGVMVRPATC